MLVGDVALSGTVPTGALRPPPGPARSGRRKGGERGRPARRQRGEGEEEDDSALEHEKGKSIPVVPPKGVGRMLAHRSSISRWPFHMAFFCGELKRPLSLLADTVLSYFLFAFLCP